MIPKRFFLLDILRGFASLSVVIWHYQHFFFIGPLQLPETFERASQPFYDFLSLLYISGGKAVELFFVLSGFIFFWLYRTNIAKNAVSAKKFFILRFSRLYPLHFLTLLVVALGQFVFFHLNEQFVVYPHNDIQHFVLNLFLATHWGFQDGLSLSFNAPVWSVSVEVVLYFTFFIYAALKFHSFISVLMMVALGFLIAIYTDNSGVGWGMFCFYAGGLSYCVYERVLSKQNTKILLPLMIGGCLLVIILAVVAINNTSDIYADAVLYAGFFPALVLLLAFLQTSFQAAGRSLRFIGDITYSVYLLHFPIQLFIIGFTTYFGLMIDFNSELFFIIFFSFLITSSMATYHFIELPAQKYLRKKLLNSTGSGRAAVPG